MTPTTYHPFCHRRVCVENSECSWPDPCLAEEEARARRELDGEHGENVCLYDSEEEAEEWVAGNAAIQSGQVAYAVYEAP